MAHQLPGFLVPEVLNRIGRSGNDRMFADASLKQRILNRCVEEEGPLDTPCLIWTGAMGGGDTGGYGHVYYRGKYPKVHRVIWWAERGEIEEGMEVCHYCNNSPCCNINHLYVATHTVNMAHAAAQKRFPDRQGEKGYAATLTNEQVSHIKYFLNQGWSVTELAKRYGVNREKLYHIKHGRKRNGNRTLQHQSSRWRYPRGKNSQSAQDKC